MTEDSDHMQLTSILSQFDRLRLKLYWQLCSKVLKLGNPNSNNIAVTLRYLANTEKDFMHLL